ncbi:ring-1,2-phenylacetyl-CoA epoxidase subunit PaaE [Aquimarina amphilecti]|uniref:Ring-1,2-phenylacetyl-CoA epoxidase subunit PaaE n=1 Tax=Aquimarina amphilecti TaxID=1038014 RepID=A0A1H7JRT2_AQUAM|nr:ferredoxin--NADP reductase [Aquimarina amphilecti]SEK76527.1 ring-1,2-phenylacetyl-CoA epoxidase subunit PaaE [Aquimarina amphilecti]
MSDFHTLTIKNITRETPKAVSIEFDIPSELKNDYSFTPGQYITIKTQVEGKEIRRAYSICSSPKSHSLRVAVKEIENGTFSAIANNKLQVGDTLDVHTPEGNFILKPDPTVTHSYAAFVAGSGITPVMSMIKSTLEEEPNSRFVLVYGNQTPSETIFSKELLSLQAEHPDRLYIEFFYSRSKEEGARFGRIEKSTINYITKNKFKDTNFQAFYLCGPEEMINTVTDVLLENEIPKGNIHFELFTSSTSNTEVNVSLDGKTSISILVDDEEFSFVMDQKKTILDAALEEDIDAPYSCQGGVCSSCICKITDGTAVMEKNSILTDGELAEGLVLACQAHPTSSSIKVDFDDV